MLVRVNDVQTDVRQGSVTVNVNEIDYVKVVLRVAQSALTDRVTGYVPCLVGSLLQTSRMYGDPPVDRYWVIGAPDGMVQVKVSTK